jgi:hypothetical protein
MVSQAASVVFLYVGRSLRSSAIDSVVDDAALAGTTPDGNGAWVSPTSYQKDRSFVASILAKLQRHNIAKDVDGDVGDGADAAVAAGSTAVATLQVPLLKALTQVADLKRELVNELRQEVSSGLRHEMVGPGGYAAVVAKLLLKTPPPTSLTTTTTAAPQWDAAALWSKLSQTSHRVCKLKALRQVL